MKQLKASLSFNRTWGHVCCYELLEGRYELGFFIFLGAVIKQCFFKKNLLFQWDRDKVRDTVI